MKHLHSSNNVTTPSGPLALTKGSLESVFCVPLGPETNSCDYPYRPRGQAEGVTLLEGVKNKNE
jgi:hypothetical protein